MRLCLGVVTNPARLFSTKKFHTKEVLAANRNETKSSSFSSSNRSVDLPNRTFFEQFNSKRSASDTMKEYSGRKLVGYSMENMFDVVADVHNYRNFLPFCKQSNVTSKSKNHLTADLIIGFPPIIEAYTSHVTLLRPHLVKAVCNECRLIKHLNTTWKFSPGLRNSTDTCIIDFYVSFEFRSALHSQLAHFFFNELVRQMEGAFYLEAKARYGKPTIKTQYLAVPSA